MQPTYLPWIGYFDMMDQVDTFVFLDTVQFDKRSWQQRNRIKGPDGWHWLTVPVLSKGRQHQRICDVEINAEHGFPEQHIKTINQFYKRSPYFNSFIDDLTGILKRQRQLLCTLNTELISWLADQLGIAARTISASELEVSGRKVELLVNLCNAVGANTYLSAVGSKDYIQQNNLFEQEDITVVYHEYSHPVYSQLYGDFVSHLSVVDLLFNEGPSSLSTIRQGRNR